MKDDPSNEIQARERGRDRDRERAREGEQERERERESEGEREREGGSQTRRGRHTSETGYQTPEIQESQPPEIQESHTQESSCRFRPMPSVALLGCETVL